MSSGADNYEMLVFKGLPGVTLLRLIRSDVKSYNADLVIMYDMQIENVSDLLSG